MEMVRFSQSDREEFWRRIAAGESAARIAASMGRYPSAVRSLQLATGGIIPAPRSRSERHLSAAEREEISRGLATGESMRSIARRLGRAPSSVSRDIARNGGPRHYRAQAADRRSWRPARRPKCTKLARCPDLAQVVRDKLGLKWSPQQISGWHEVAHPGPGNARVTRDPLPLALRPGTRRTQTRVDPVPAQRRALRRPQGRQAPCPNQFRDMVMISERPAEVADRAVPGHWEGDPIMGTKNSSIATLVERSTRYVMLMKVERPSAECAREAVAAKILKLPEQLRRSLTWDQGSEMARHVRFRVDTGVQVYFCDPHSPWPRGSNENTNGLLRQYFPKGTDLSRHSQESLDAVAGELNELPCKTLGWVTPWERLNEALR